MKRSTKATITESEKKTDGKDPDEPDEMYEMESFVKKKRLQNRVLKKLTENLDNETKSASGKPATG